MTSKVTLNVDIPTEIDTRFREAIFKKYGYRSGVIKKCVIEVMLLWMDNEKHRGIK